MIRCVGWREYLTDDVLKMFNEKESIVKVIEQTCVSCPEQYDCFDEFGNQIGYLRLRYRYFEVSCPSYTFSSQCVYAIKTQGYGNFSAAERVGELSNAIDAIDHFYREIHQCIRKVDGEEDEDGNDIYEIKDQENVTMQDILERLYYYQECNMLPFQVKEIHEKGPVVGFNDACMKIIKDHRLRRSEYFPEANGADGISKEHMEAEILFLYDDPKWNSMIKNICWLFDKKFDDFTKVFKNACEKGWNSL